jgi:hypothetical protein
MLVVWVGLLGMALPTLACPGHGHACCSHDSQLPCGGNSPDNDSRFPIHSISGSCCTDAPAVTGVPTAQLARTQLEPNDLSHSPQPIVVLFWVLAAQPPEWGKGLSAHVVPVYQPNASLTYLRTARLRL